MKDTKTIIAIIIIATTVVVGITILSTPIPQQASGQDPCEQKGWI